MHSCMISSDFVCVHKSTYWNVVDARVHKQFYCVSCGGINNLIWIFSLHFDIRWMFLGTTEISHTAHFCGSLAEEIPQ